jgi:hypothetical protein
VVDWKRQGAVQPRNYQRVNDFAANMPPSCGVYNVSCCPLYSEATADVHTTASSMSACSIAQPCMPIFGSEATTAAARNR